MSQYRKTKKLALTFDMKEIAYETSAIFFYNGQKPGCN